MKKIKTLLALGAIAATALTSSAVSIAGNISIAGAAVADNTDLTVATAITSFGASFVTAADGDYLGTAGQSVTYTPFAFRPVLSPSPVTPLWTFATGGLTYSFELTSLSIDAGGTANSLTLHGLGNATITGGTSSFDSTPGTWVFTLNNAGSTFSYSSSDSVPTPDGGATAALIGVGLLGLGALRRKA